MYTIGLPKLSLECNPARAGIHRYYQLGMRSIYLEPDAPINTHLEHRASIGIQVTSNYRIPVGVVAHCWRGNVEALHEARAYLLTLMVLLIALLDPIMSLRQRRYYDVPHQLKVLLTCLIVVLLVQPLYELGWQVGRFVANHRR